MKPGPQHQYPCSRCGTPINCWPFEVGRACCVRCLKEIRSKNGKAVSENQAAPIGTEKMRSFRGRNYMMVYLPNHPDAPIQGWLMKHRIVMESKIGRRLLPEEVVHHIDHNGLNNDPANLELIESKGKHLALHHSADGVAIRMANYPHCACGAQTAYGETVCWKCWSRSQTCPTCGRPDRKMARRDMCHGCYKAFRVREGRVHRRPVS